MLSKISKPSLLLPGYLQVVPKAQKIQLNPGEEQDGIWHQDGESEHITAVVIYYKKCKGFNGGKLEFIQRTGESFYITEDRFPSVGNMKQCKVDSLSGRLIVFSNYELVHRVLKMTNTGTELAVREFIVLFIVDQRYPLKTIDDIRKDDIVEQDKIVNDRDYCKNRRDEKFKMQLQPKRSFGANTQMVHSTGNGTAAQVMFQYNEDNQNMDR